MPAVRILVCASEAPRAPLNGSRLVLYELCARLAARADVTVLALRRPDQDGEPPAGIELHEVALPDPGPLRAWALRGAALALREPVDARRLAAPFLRALPLERSFDVAHVMLGSLAGIAPALGMPAVIAPLDAWHLNVRAEAERAAGAERIWRRAQERAVRRWQATAYRAFARVIVVTEEDARALDPSLPVTVIPNGVDAASFAPPGGERSGVVFTGALDTPANEAAAVRLAERIMPRVPAQLTLVGRSPTERVRALGGVVGDVPDIRPWLWGAAAYACPMDSGTGIKNKLLEAMAAGAPAVATPLACQGLGVRDGEHLLIAESDADFAAALTATLQDRDAAARRADAARAYVRARHDWDAVAAAYHAVYEQIA
jgi:glycosyltransferase involved in cell wall biosynthesis